MRPIETARLRAEIPCAGIPRADKALQGLLLGLPISMALWVGIGMVAATAIS